MTITGTAYIGTYGQIATASVDKSADMISLQNGMSRFDHARELTARCSKEKQWADYYGLCNNESPANSTTFGGTGLIVQSASQTRTEVVTDRQMGTDPAIALSNGTFVAPDHTKIIQYTENMLWLGYEDSISLTITYEGGTSIPAAAMLKPGGKVTWAIGLHPVAYPTGSAITASPTTTTVGLARVALEPVVYGAYDSNNPYIVRSVNFNQSSGDWHTAAIELSKFVPNSDTDGSSSPLLSQLSLWATASALNSLGGEYMFDGTATNAFPAFYMCTITINLTSGGVPTMTEDVEFYPSDSAQTDYMSLT